MSGRKEIRSEEIFNQELEAEIFLWTHGDKEDLGICRLDDRMRQNKLRLLKAAKEESDRRLKIFSGKFS